MKFNQNKKEKNRRELMKKFSEVTAYMMREIGSEDVETAFEVGKIAYNRFLREEKNKRKPKIETYEINAKTKEQAIKQVKALELPKHVEKVVLEQLLKK